MEGSCMSSGGCMKGNVSYVSQSPWIKAGTVKENVLFELDEDKERYDTIMEACALVPDLQQLPLGDRTELGERGINLSGGQKARLALARAAYADAEINLLDDPLSAVDPRVGRILFETCIGNKGVMKGKTRVLVTHQSQYLPQCDLIAVMRSGKIVAFAPWEQLNSNLFEEIASSDEAQSGIENATFSKNNEGNLPATAENGGRSDTSKEIGTTLLKAQEGSAFVLSESKETGVVSWSVYGSFIKCVGFFRSILALLLCISTASFICLCNWWLSEWAKADISTQRSKRWVWINGSFVCGAVCLSLSFAMLTVTSVVRGSTKLHDQMTNRVMRAPLHFFHTNPTGRIVNRFSKDQGLVDDLLPSIALTVFASMSLVLASMVLLIMAVPFVVPLVALVVVLFVRLRSTYIKSSREVKRYEGMTRSPVYASVSETLKGLVTIRAFGVQRQFEESFLMHLDKNGAWWNAFIVTSRWLGLRLDMLSVSLVLGGVVLASVLKDQVSTQLLAFSLVRLFPVCWTLQWGVRQSAEMENLMTSVERMTEYTRIQQEHPRTCDGVVHPGPKWPANGSLTCKNLTVSYRQDLDPVLKNINFEIPGGSSVGVVGRTGSGKSSLILAIYRLLDATSGGIWLDGVDISKMGIDVLRSQLTIIPQDPVLFRGSVRMNLDPTGLFSDAEIWRVLAMSRLTQVVEKLGGLDEFLTDCGEMLSVGEKQLMCLARALLQDASIIILDEATANVDLVTDGIIQETLQHSRHLRKAGGRVPTMVTIAHRINTVMHSDLLIVLDNGNLVEFGPPSQLLKQNGYFTSMVEASKHMSIH